MLVYNSTDILQCTQIGFKYMYTVVFACDVLTFQLVIFCLDGFLFLSLAVSESVAEPSLKTADLLDRGLHLVC